MWEENKKLWATQQAQNLGEWQGYRAGGGARAQASRGPHLRVQSWYAAVCMNPAALEAGVALGSNAEGTE